MATALDLYDEWLYKCLVGFRDGPWVARMDMYTTPTSIILGVGAGRWNILHVDTGSKICEAEDFPSMNPLVDKDASIMKSINRWVRSKVYAPEPTAQSESVYELEGGE